MKRLLTHPMLILGFFIAIFPLDSYAQQVKKICWDFEDPCPNPADAFHIGCILAAQSASGSPDTKSDYAGIAPFNGSKYAHMYAKYCFIEPGDPNRYHTEGIILKQTFVAGVQYKISFAVRSLGSLAPTETKVILVNDMPNYGGIGTPGLGCLNTLDILPHIPLNSQTIATYSASEISATGWEIKTIIFTPQSNFNQIWFRPRAISGAVNGELSTDLYMDDVCVEYSCPPLTYTVSICDMGYYGPYNVPTSNYSMVSVEGGEIIPTEWTLNRVYDCAGGLKPSNIKQSMLINWFPGNTGFALPNDDDCYILSVFHARPGCDPVRADFILDMDQWIPYCDNLCNDWHLSMTLDYCTDVSFSAAHDIDSPDFPASTVFTFSWDNSTVIQTGNSPTYAPTEAPNEIEAGQYLCVQVEQEGCPPMYSCAQYLLSCIPEEEPGPCNSWTARMTVDNCISTFWEVIPTEGAPNLPANTYYTFSWVTSFGAQVVANGTNAYYFDEMTDPMNESGWATMCIEVQTPGCLPVKKCFDYAHDCYFGPKPAPRSSSGAQGSEQQDLEISNPSTGQILFAHSLAQGTASLYSTQGALVKSFQLNGTDHLDVSELVTGQYILAIQSQDVSVSKLVFIQNQH